MLAFHYTTSQRLLLVLNTKFGLLFLTNFHAACSACVFDAAYIARLRSSVYGGGAQAAATASSFQVSGPMFSSTFACGSAAAHDEEVYTKALTEGSVVADFKALTAPDTTGVILTFGSKPPIIEAI